MFGGQSGPVGSVADSPGRPSGARGSLRGPWGSPWDPGGGPGYPLGTQEQPLGPLASNMAVKRSSLGVWSAICGTWKATQGVRGALLCAKTSQETSLGGFTGTNVDKRKVFQRFCVYLWKAIWVPWKGPRTPFGPLGKSSVISGGSQSPLESPLGIAWAPPRRSWRVVRWSLGSPGWS